MRRCSKEHRQHLSRESSVGRDHFTQAGPRNRQSHPRPRGRGRRLRPCHHAPSRSPRLLLHVALAQPGARQRRGHHGVRSRLQSHRPGRPPDLRRAADPRRDLQGATGDQFGRAQPRPRGAALYGHRGEAPADDPRRRAHRRRHPGLGHRRPFRQQDRPSGADHGAGRRPGALPRPQQRGADARARRHRRGCLPQGGGADRRLSDGERQAAGRGDAVRHGEISERRRDREHRRDLGVAAVARSRVGILGGPRRGWRFGLTAGLSSGPDGLS